MAAGEDLSDASYCEVKMITFYQVEWCPYCHRVREALTELGLDYATVNVPTSRPDRIEVIELSGQERVPVIKDGDLVIADSARIVAYLNETYGPQADAEERARHEQSGAFRTVTAVDDPPSTPSAD
jgi:glutathione S-transferase